MVLEVYVGGLGWGDYKNKTKITQVGGARDPPSPTMIPTAILFNRRKFVRLHNQPRVFT